MDGKRLSTTTTDAKRRIGYVPQELALYPRTSRPGRTCASSPAYTACPAGLRPGASTTCSTSWA
ncbi:hypothetical protein [Saccharothrix ecbatanensis]|uniref:hypothetical protein n=1 Tax=Saccharothrix ecbatanensis TaxID=1105145 RepID=UPI0028A63B18|nr:hypothetical protein [Saccharothrix ecbatanensis]